MATKKEDQKLVFKTDHRLMQVKSTAECSKGSILQYFRPTLSLHVSKIFVVSIFEWPLKTGFTVIIIKGVHNFRKFTLCCIIDPEYCFILSDKVEPNDMLQSVASHLDFPK